MWEKEERLAWMSKNNEMKRKIPDKTEIGPGEKKDDEMYQQVPDGWKGRQGDDRKGLELLAPEVTIAAKNSSLREETSTA